MKIKLINSGYKYLWNVKYLYCFFCLPNRCSLLILTKYLPLVLNTLISGRTHCLYIPNCLQIQIVQSIVHRCFYSSVIRRCKLLPKWKVLLPATRIINSRVIRVGSIRRVLSRNALRSQQLPTLRKLRNLSLLVYLFITLVLAIVCSVQTQVARLRCYRVSALRCWTHFR